MSDFVAWERERLRPPYRIPRRELVSDEASVENPLPFITIRADHPDTFTVDPSYDELLAALKAGSWLEVEVFGAPHVSRDVEGSPGTFTVTATREARVITVLSVETMPGHHKYQLAHHFHVVHHYDGWVPHSGGDEYSEETAEYTIILDHRMPATMRGRVRPAS